MTLGITRELSREERIQILTNMGFTMPDWLDTKYAWIISSDMLRAADRFGGGIGGSLMISPKEEVAHVRNGIAFATGKLYSIGIPYTEETAPPVCVLSRASTSVYTDNDIPAGFPVIIALDTRVMDEMDEEPHGVDGIVRYYTSGGNTIEVGGDAFVGGPEHMQDVRGSANGMTLRPDPDKVTARISLSGEMLLRVLQSIVPTAMHDGTGYSGVGTPTVTLEISSDRPGVIITSGAHLEGPGSAIDEVVFGQLSLMSIGDMEQFGYDYAESEQKKHIDESIDEEDIDWGQLLAEKNEQFWMSRPTIGLNMEKLQKIADHQWGGAEEDSDFSTPGNKSTDLAKELEKMLERVREAAEGIRSKHDDDDGPEL